MVVVLNRLSIDSQGIAMSQDEREGLLHSKCALILGVVVVVILGLALLVLAGCKSSTPTEDGRVDWLEGSIDLCVACHRIETPGIVKQFGYSTMAAAGNTCRDCHEVQPDHPGAVEHWGTFRLPQPTPLICQECHATKVAQFYQSRHSLPAYVAMEGTQDLTPEHLAIYESIPEGSFAPDQERNALFVLEGADITRFACEGCHNIGQPKADGSVGQCQDCHQRHIFSLEQARRPETCNACHIGPDHPQWEIYQESGHGIAYATDGHNWNWEAEPDTLAVSDIPAATCATCHLSAFGGTEATHDVGERLTWYLFASISERRPDWQDNQARMQSVCRECHNDNFITAFYTDADKATEAVNAWVAESNSIMAQLRDEGLLTAAPFDEPIDFVFFNLWHHWGRTAKFGAWMQGPDYTQWHGAYEVLHDLAELRKMASEKLAKAGE